MFLWWWWCPLDCPHTVPNTFHSTTDLRSVSHDTDGRRLAPATCLTRSFLRRPFMALCR
ncbi:unnamed protein product, partial [Cylicocyclus nassatus]